MKKEILLFAACAFFTFENEAQTITDYDGNIYNTTTIGTQIWMTENLHVLHYNDGSPIPLVTGTSAWAALTTGARCYYNNDSLSNAAAFGCLYNWAAVVDPRGICPLGWHVPSDADFQTLLSFLGGINVAGGPLKETGFTRWNSPNSGATNSSNFTGVGGGNRGSTGSFFSLGGFGDYWATTSSSSSAKDIALHYSSVIVANGWTDKKFGFSVRFVCDSLITTSIPENNNQQGINIFPNPANSRIYISCAETQYTSMQIYNLVGECVLQKILRSETNEIDISSLSKGVYIIQISGPDKAIQQKLIKE